jgi:hypothetical protein
VLTAPPLLLPPDVPPLLVPPLLVPPDVPPLLVPPDVPPLLVPPDVPPGVFGVALEPVAPFDGPPGAPGVPSVPFELLAGFASSLSAAELSPPLDPHARSTTGDIAAVDNVRRRWRMPGHNAPVMPSHDHKGVYTASETLREGKM